MKTSIKPILIAFLFFSNSLIFAQDIDPFDPGADPGIVPIKNYIIPMIVLGIVLSFFILKKRKTT